MTLAQQTENRFTYKDYLTWPDEERWELIDGEIYDMTPAPSFIHQKIVLNLASLLRDRLKDVPCVTGIAPTDVILSEHDVVHPDVFVVCDEDKITEANIQGSPDLIIEVISPVFRDVCRRRCLSNGPLCQRDDRTSAFTFGALRAAKCKALLSFSIHWGL